MGEGLGERKRGSTGSNIKVLCALVFALDPCLARFPNVARVNIRPQAVRAPWLGGDDLPQLGPPRRGVVEHLHLAFAVGAPHEQGRDTAVGVVHLPCNHTHRIKITPNQ